jgi:alpha-D-ribose 1-methylphosphonate 5-phosphate C-P lyase
MSYTNNSLSIIGGTGITVTPVTNTGATTITIDSTGAGLLTTRTAVTTPDTVLITDQVVNYEVPGPVPVAVTLPAGVNGQLFYIKDGLGLATPVTPITITATAGTIDGAATATINAPYGALTFVYTGVEWKLL